MMESETLGKGQRVVIAGGSGFLGRSLARYLSAKGFEITLLARRQTSLEEGWQFVRWDGHSGGDWAQTLDGAFALVNLAGRSVDCLKTPEHCDEILRSRVESTRALGQALRNVDQPPGVWVQMSTAHCYGDPPRVVCDESSAFGYGLAPFVAQAWEKAHATGLVQGMRSVVLRTSFVLGRDGGALSKLSRMARVGLGGSVGNGQQGMSWIHEEDMNRIFERAMLDPSMEGAYVATGPHPVSNAVFMRALRQAVGMPIGLPAFAWMVKVGARFVLRTDPELALCGRYCVPTRLMTAGFEFRHPEIGEALEDLLSC